MLLIAIAARAKTRGEDFADQFRKTNNAHPRIPLAAGLYSGTPAAALCMIVSVLLGTLVLVKTKWPLRVLDWIVLLLVPFEIPSLLHSQYRANSIRLAWPIPIAVLFYFAVRLTILTSAQIASLSGLLGAAGTWLSLSGLRQFAENARFLGEAGFSNLVPFRARLISPPSPWIPGEWFTVLLLTLPFACAFSAYLYQEQLKLYAAVAALAPVVITATLFLSLSRAVFWSAVVFFIMLCALMIAARIISFLAGTMLLGSALAAFVLILGCESAVFQGIFQAYSGLHTSQVRSTLGRVEIWNRSLELVRAHPFTGVGAANSALMLLSSADEEETTGFASRTYSLPVQILVEKGIIGFVLYTVFLALVAREFVLMLHSPPIRDPDKRGCGPSQSGAKHRRTQVVAEANDNSAYKAMVCSFAAGLIAVLFRELTYSSLLEHSLTLALVAALAALICRPQVT